MGKRIFTVVALLVIFVCPGLFAQDPGIPDTVSIDSVKVLQNSQAVVNVNFYNDEEIMAVQLPLHYSSPDISVDSVSFIGSRLAYIGTKVVTKVPATQQLIVVVIVVMEANIPPGQGLGFKIYFNIPSGIPDQKIVLDTLFYPPSTYMSFIDAVTNDDIFPVLKKGKIIVGNPQDPPIIGVTPDSLNFQGIAGQAPPGVQYLQIKNLGEGTLNWSTSKKSSWLEISPPSGVGLSTVQIFANSIGLPVGEYYDTIVVSCPAATNTPVPVPVRLKLTEPPPTISISPTSFNFSAVAGSGNPPSQTLTVDNSGQGVLHWTASKSSTWLVLDPISGTDHGVVTLSPDITGLPYGVYYDTVVISDPEATNNPRKATVRLEVASSLPLLAVDSPTIVVVVDTYNPYPPDRNFLIYNAGGGSMTYSVSENSPRITGLTPASGSVPQSVAASFKTLSGGPGDDYFDTVVVTSPEAINSPQYVEFIFHYVTVPAQMDISKDSVSAQYYECSDGTGTPPPVQKFSIYLYGTDTASYHLSWKSTWLQPNHDTGPLSATITLNFNHRGLPVGDYYDTIVVSSPNVINSPQKLPVMMHILSTAVAPFMTVSYGDTIQLVAQENRAGKDYFIQVNNSNPGCMPWSVQEDIPWLSYNIDSLNTTYPWQLQFMPFAGGIIMGTYYASCQLLSPTASNTPITLNFKFQVWKFFGDVNYDGRVNIRDVTYLMRYLYMDGPMPKPERRVGDCNCDFMVNINDITEIINYLYIDLNPICGNPY